MIHIQKYSSLSDAAAGLAAVLEQHQPADPLVEQSVVVPNMDTARWLKLELAEIRGLSANLNMILPSDWQYRMIRNLYSDLPKKLPSDILPMAWSLFDLLSDNITCRQYPLLNDYITRQSTGHRETAIWQLSSQIASVFDQYLVYRPEMMISWQNGNTGKSADEQWQAKLWNQLNSRWKTLSDPAFHQNRAELHKDLIRALHKGEVECIDPLFVFNPGLMPAPILHSLKNFSEQQEVLFLYSSPLQSKKLNSELNSRNTPLNPPLLGGNNYRGEFLDSFGHEALELEQLYHKHFGVAELIESVEPIGRFKSTGIGDPGNQVGPAEKDRPAEQSGQDVPGDQDRSAEITGQVGSLKQAKQDEQAGQIEQGHQIGTGGQMNFTVGLDNSKSNQQKEMTNLNRIQEAIRKNKPSKTGNPTPGDGSIRIHSCHSPLREVETLYQTLLELFEEDHTLTPDDILVAMPDPDPYEPYIKAVFGTTEEGLPAIPWHLGSGTVTENVIENCLRLWLELPDSRFRKQPILDLFSMQPVRDKADISESDVNEVKRWITENNVMWGMNGEHRKEMGQPPVHAQTWYSALKRGWLGQWIADEPGLIYDDTLLFAGIRTASQKEAWAAFSEYLNHLDRARKEAETSRTGREWCRWVEEKLGELIGLGTLAQNEASTVRNALDQVSQSCATAESQQQVSFGMIRSVILALLDRKSSAGALFTRGVTFSSMVPVRSIPFRVIALIGLNDGTFPRKETVIDFDLMARQPELGERNRKHEDRNLFLESILAASDIHYISYVGQSPVDNEEIPPSTIVSEWIDQVSAVSGVKREAVVQKEALHLFSESYFRQQNKGVYSKLAWQTAPGLKTRADTIQGLKPDLIQKVDHEWMQGITLERLIRFFKNPVRAYLTEQLGASFRSPDEEKDEFSLNHLEKHLIFQKMMGWLIAGRNEPEIFELIRYAGMVPEGWAGESLLTELLNHCKTAIRFLRNRGEEPQFTELNVDLQAGELHFSESLQSYRTNSLMDVEPSALSGALLIQTWIRHLAWQASSGTNSTSNLLCELKKGDPRWCIFKEVEKPLEILQKLVSLYQKGQSEPLFFFPKALYAYKDAVEKGEGEKSVDKAALEFEGGDYRFGEKDDLSIQILLSPEAEFKTGYLADEFLDVVNEMHTHLEVQP